MEETKILQAATEIHIKEFTAKWDANFATDTNVPTQQNLHKDSPPAPPEALTASHLTHHLHQGSNKYHQERPHFFKK